MHKFRTKEWKGSLSFYRVEKIFYCDGRINRSAHTNDNVPLFYLCLRRIRAEIQRKNDFPCAFEACRLEIYRSIPESHSVCKVFYSFFVYMFLLCFLLLRTLTIFILSDTTS